MGQTVNGRQTSRGGAADLKALFINLLFARSVTKVQRCENARPTINGLTVQEQ